MHYKLSYPGQGILGPALAIFSSQPTTLPSAFSIIPPQDPTWHMNTGASSHLNFNASNISTVFDKRLFPSVHIGDGKSIPVTNTGHSIIPSHNRPLHLHNILDYLTRHILLRCDSLGDLYPVTKPSTSPIAFLSTSASTWHQRLGHPALLPQNIGSLNNEFNMTDLGALNYFLGIYVDRTPTGFLSHKKYALKLLEHAHMVNCNPSRTPVDTESKLDLERLPSLLWFTGTGLGSVKAKYHGVANVVAETAWVRNLLCELHSPLMTVTLVYCDNNIMPVVPFSFLSVDSVATDLVSSILFSSGSNASGACLRRDNSSKSYSHAVVCSLLPTNLAYD
ncbi:ribonuclease H-like domain-containing protein [Tanacetum coccineum]|uniref:Ribonuclease H-like domain-containing protein n=1 Tax=Tanacetum coccineum TaxID=301880 RepID=A0ABQ5IR22_9ASTR